jgi:hypothetical protein
VLTPESGRILRRDSFGVKVHMKCAYLVLVLVLTSGSCPELAAATPVVSQRTVAARQVPAGITATEAIGIVRDLPEARAWSTFISEQSKGGAHAAMMVEPQQPKEMEGKYYWSVNFYENQPTHFHRWQTFMVRLDGKEILVDDVVSGEYRHLKEWRIIDKPMDRVRAKKVP